MNEAKIFLDKKQKEHFNKFGVYADVNSKIAEWMQEYTDEVVKKLPIPVVVQQSEQYCECKKPTLGKSVSRCGTCDEWFKPLK